MAILMIHDVSDGRLAEYDRVIKAARSGRAGESAGATVPRGRAEGDGYLVVDVWESQEAFDRFGQTLVPLLEQAGGRVPTPQIHPVHNVIKGA